MSFWPEPKKEDDESDENTVLTEELNDETLESE